MQVIGFYLAFAQYFVTLYRGGSRQAVRNKVIWFSDAVLFVVEWRQNMVFLTRAWVQGRGIMGRNEGYVRTGIKRGCHLGLRTNRVLFVSFGLIFVFFV